MRRLPVGIDNYGLFPLDLSPLETLKWAEANGAEGVQFSGLSSKEHRRVDDSYLKDLAQYAANYGLYLEWGGGQHIPFDTKTWEEKDTFRINRRAAEEASTLGINLIRSCSGDLMRWNPDNPKTEFLIKKTAESLKAQRRMLSDLGVTLAIETHFEFTTHDLLKIFEMCDAEPGGYLGICLDTMNVLTMLEDPAAAADRVLPWVVSTHIKDGGLMVGDKGLVSFPAEIGRGVLELKAILGKIASLSHEVNFSVEDHGGSFELPVFNPAFLSEFPDLTLQEFAALIKISQRTAEAVRNRGLGIVDRSRWPEVCEARMKRNIRALKNLL